MLKSRLKNRMIVIIMALFYVSCVSETLPPVAKPVVLMVHSDSLEAEQSFTAAVELFNAEKFSDAKAAFIKFEKKFPDEELVFQSNLYQGRIELLNHNYNKAEDFFEKAKLSPTDMSVVDYGGMYLGITKYHLKDYKEAFNILVSYAGKFTKKSEKLEIADCLWRSAKALGDYVNSSIWLDAYLKAAPDSEIKESTVKEFKLFLEDIKNPDIIKRSIVSLKELSKKESSEVKAILLIKLARLLYDAGDYNELQSVVKDIRKQGGEYLTEIENIMLMVELQEDVNMETIGVLLPLSGSMRMVGQEILKGVMLGSKQFRFGKEQMALSVVIKDTGGNKDKALSAFEELVRKDRVSAVIGPLDIKASKAVSVKAKQLGVPLISLSGDNTVAKESDYVFWNFMSADFDVQALWHSIVPDIENRVFNKDSSNISKFPDVAVIYPDNSFGRKMTTLFYNNMNSENVQREYVVKIPFDPLQHDFAKTVKKLVKYKFDVLFLPLTASQLALAAPSLAAENIWSSKQSNSLLKQPVLFLIPQAGYSQSVILRAGRYLQNARFVSGFNKKFSKGADTFNMFFENEYKKSPSVYASYGYDAVIIEGTGISAGVSSRYLLKQFIESNTSGQKMSMPFNGFTKDGIPVALPVVKQLDGRTLIDIKHER